MLVICLAFCLSISVSASANGGTATNIGGAGYIPSPYEVINLYSTHPEIEYDIIASMQLMSFSGEYAYTIYQLSPYGYAILYNATNGLMEANYSEHSTLPVEISSDTLCYYGGPGLYCIWEDDMLLNLFDNAYLDEEVICEIVARENCAQEYELEKAVLLGISQPINSTTNTTSVSTTTESHAVQYSYFSNLVKYGLNTKGTCTVIAIAMLLGYYDNYVNDKFVADEYEDGDGTTESFHQLLNSYVYGSGTVGAIKIRNVAAQINNYLADSNLRCTLKSEYSSQSAAIEKIIAMLQAGEPVVASMAVLYGANYNHSVLIYKVVYDSTDPVNTAVVTMNAGWGSGTRDGQSNTEYVASAGWFYECGYIESSCSSHSVTVWRDFNATYHCRNCVYCNYIEYELHSSYWNQILGCCTRCGRTGHSTAD